MLALPFTIGDGFEDEPPPVHGRISFGGGSVTLEFEGDPNTSTGSRKVVIGVSEFVAARYRRGLICDRLFLRAGTWGAFGGVPGAAMDLVALRFARRDRSDAEQLATRIENVIGERSRWSDESLQQAI